MKGCRQARGFTLVEIMMALVLGLVLISAILVVFVDLKRTSSETSTYISMHERAFIALDLLAKDIAQQGFFGDYILGLNLVTSPINSEYGCQGGGGNNATFPKKANATEDNAPFITLWGANVTQKNIMNCIDDAKISSDVIQFKRVVANPLTETKTNRFYFVSNAFEGEIFSGSTIPTLDNARLWQYQQRIYYIKNDKNDSNTIPILMQGRLTKQMTFSGVIDGIEMIKFMFGIDKDVIGESGYGVADTFISADKMTDDLWQQSAENRIVVVRIYLLARAIQPDLHYINTNSYHLAGKDFTFNDHYRRVLLTRTVPLRNSWLKSW